jgi:hypothetical protein
MFNFQSLFGVNNSKFQRNFELVTINYCHNKKLCLYAPRKTIYPFKNQDKNSKNQARFYSTLLSQFLSN